MAKRNMPPKTEFKAEEEEEVTNIPLEPTNNPFSLVVSNCTSVNVREKPAKDSKIISVLKYGNPVLVDEMNGDWYHITEANAKKLNGYIFSSYLSE